MPLTMGLLQHLPARFRPTSYEDLQKEWNRSCKVAERRARKLLRTYLTKAQQTSLTKRGYFCVRGNKTKRLYRIYCGRKVCRVSGFGNTGNLGQNICCKDWWYGTHFEGSGAWSHAGHKVVCPPSDLMLAQKLLLETNEAQFLRLACRSQRWS